VGTGKGTRYFPEEILHEKRWSFQLRKDELAKLGEDQIFQDLIRPNLISRVSQNVVERCAYIATEVLNNVIDHSAATTVSVSIDLLDGKLQLDFIDDGIGAFEKVKAYFRLQSVFEAAGEIAKGKRTTDASRHAGEGIFFSSRIADHFTLEANGIAYEYIDTSDDWTVKESGVQTGTQVKATLVIASDKTVVSVFDRYTEDHLFKFRSPRLVSPYVIALPSGQFPSRSEAKKILAGADKFESIVIDFKYVESIGQGFADEIFRVFRDTHPQVKIEIRNANEMVSRMIQYVTGSSKPT
jgi:anti-sigma regulatory factor (Ser/Thr protein kinase)